MVNRFRHHKQDCIRSFYFKQSYIEYEWSNPTMYHPLHRVMSGSNYSLSLGGSLWTLACTASTPVMPSLLQTCNDLFAKVPLLTEHEFDLLLHLDKQLGNQGIQTDLSLMAQEQNLTARTLLLTTGTVDVPNPEATSTCTHQRDYENTCLQCEDFARKHDRWTQQSERHRAAKRTPSIGSMMPLNTCESIFRTQPSFMFESIVTGGQHAEGVLAMKLPPSLQGPDALQLFSQAMNRPSPPAGIPYPLDTIKSQISPTAERIEPPNSPAQYPQVDILAQGLIGNGDGHIEHWPGISFLSQSDKISLPEMSFFLEDNTRLSGLNANKSDARNQTPTTHSISDTFALHDQHAKGISRPSNVTQNSTDPTQSTSSGTHKKDTQPKPKKSHVPIRRWSQTYLNGLIHKHAPRNLPEGIQFTDRTDVQELPLATLVPPIKAVEAEIDGEIRFIGAGTRVDVPIPQTQGWDWTVNVDGGMTRAEPQLRRVKETPFRVVTMNKEGTILIDMNWVQDVTVDEDSISGIRDGETGQG